MTNPTEALIRSAIARRFQERHRTVLSPTYVETCAQAAYSVVEGLEKALRDSKTAINFGVNAPHETLGYIETLIDAALNIRSEVGDSDD